MRNILAVGGVTVIAVALAGAAGVPLLEPMAAAALALAGVLLGALISWGSADQSRYSEYRLEALGKIDDLLAEVRRSIRDESLVAILNRTGGYEELDDDIGEASRFARRLADDTITKGLFATRAHLRRARKALTEIDLDRPDAQQRFEQAELDLARRMKFTWHRVDELMQLAARRR